MWSIPLLTRFPGGRNPLRPCFGAGLAVRARRSEAAIQKWNRHMSNESHLQRSALGTRRGRPDAPADSVGVMLGGHRGGSALAGCAPDNGDTSSALRRIGRRQWPIRRRTNARAASLAPAPAAPACPKAVTPQCPTAPAAAPTRLAVHGARTRVHAVHHHAYRQHREWATTQRPAEHLDEARGYGRGLTHGDWIASERDGLLGGPGGELRGGYRVREETRETERSEVSRSYGGERIVETDRELGRHVLRPCPSVCRAGWTGAGRGGDYRTAGVEGGYLVWPGKVEYCRPLRRRQSSTTRFVSLARRLGPS